MEFGAHAGSCGPTAVSLGASAPVPPFPPISPPFAFLSPEPLSRLPTPPSGPMPRSQHVLFHVSFPI
jgi:hypothetical protein